eukprot:1159436-Pelagomonas_calceolata.AAC.5
MPYWSANPMQKRHRGEMKRVTGKIKAGGCLFCSSCVGYRASRDVYILDDQKMCVDMKGRRNKKVYERFLSS